MASRGAHVCLFVLCSTALTLPSFTAAVEEALNTASEPGWLPNIQNPRVRAAFADAARLHQETIISADGNAGVATPYQKVAVEQFQTGATAAQGMWRTPHPNPNPLQNGTKGLSGAVGITMVYLTDGTVLFTERPHDVVAGVPANPLLVNNKVGAIATLYTASYHGNQPYVAPAAQDTWVPVDAVSQAFCVGATVTYLGEAFEWGGDNECVGCIYRSQADLAAGIPLGNGFYDVRTFTPGARAMVVHASEYNDNSATGKPNGARDCCVQAHSDPTPIPESCVPDANCSPRWYPTVTTLPTGNINVMGGALVTSGNNQAVDMNPTWNSYNVATRTIGTAQPMPTNIVLDQVPWSTYALVYLLPTTASLMVVCGFKTQFYSTYNDMITGVDNTYGLVPNLPYPVNFIYMAGNVILPLKYPDYTFEVIIMGGSDYAYDGDNGQTWSQRLTNIGPGQTAKWVVDEMGHPRIESISILLPDGTVYMTGGAGSGTAGGSFDSGNAFSDFQTAPQIYYPDAPLGQRWTGYLADSGVDRGYHSTALLIASGEVITAGSEPTSEYRVQYYTPGYLLSGKPRPSITQAPTSLGYNAPFTVSYTLASPATITSIVIIRTAGSTHSNQMDQRMIKLYMSVSGTTITSLTPPDATIAPPGYYMLFIVSSDGVPSVASFVLITGAYTPIPRAPFAVANTIASGQKLAGNTPLYCANRQVFAILQGDGNLVVYRATAYIQVGGATASAVWSSGSYGISNNAPFTLNVTGCAVYITDSTGAVILHWAAAAGTAPCGLQVRNDGSLALVDAHNLAVLVNGMAVTPAANPAQPSVPGSASPSPSPPASSPPPANTGTLPPNAGLVQGQNLYSADGEAYLILQTDGNLVLYNTALVNKYGPSAAAAVWNSATYGLGKAPYILNMQLDCNAVIYDGGYVTSGFSAANAIWDSATYETGTAPCTLVVSSSGGGSLTIVNNAGAVIFRRP